MTLWRWWRDRRESRFALAEMVELQLRDEAVLMDVDTNPINLAKIAVNSGDLAAAAILWERALTLVPNSVFTSNDSVTILIGLKRLDEAELLMRERRKRYPSDDFWPKGLAFVAEARGDAVEAVKRWQFVRRRVPYTHEGYYGCAKWLAVLGRFDEAETQLDHALERMPDHPELLAVQARLSDQRNDWVRSLARWRHLAETHPSAEAFGAAARVLIELERIKEADAYLEEASRLFPLDLGIAIAHARLARQNGDLSSACARWERVRSIDPNFHDGYKEGANCLSEAGRHAEADAVLQAAIDRFPDQVWPLHDFARLAHDRKDWTDAAVRWDALRQRFPNEADGHSRLAEALAAAGRGDEVSSSSQNPASGQSAAVEQIDPEIAEVEFDEAWYLSQNPQVAEAVRQGGFRSGWQHYILHGRDEGRMPVPPGPESGR